MDNIEFQIQAVLNDTIKRMIMQLPNAAVQYTPPRNPPEILAADPKPSVDPILVAMNEMISQICRKPPSPQQPAPDIVQSAVDVTPLCTPSAVQNPAVPAGNLGVDPMLLGIMNGILSQICDKPPLPQHPAPDTVQSPADLTPLCTPSAVRNPAVAAGNSCANSNIDSNVNSNIDAHSTMADSDSSDSCESDIELEEPAEESVEKHLKEKPDSHSFNLVDDEGSFGTYVAPTAAVTTAADSTAATAVPTTAMPAVCPPLPSGVSLDQIPPRDAIFNSRCKVKDLKVTLRLMKAPLSGNKAVLLARLDCLLHRFWVHRGEDVRFARTYELLNI